MEDHSQGHTANIHVCVKTRNANIVQHEDVEKSGKIEQQTTGENDTSGVLRYITYLYLLTFAYKTPIGIAKCIAMQ